MITLLPSANIKKAAIMAEHLGYKLISSNDLKDLKIRMVKK